MVICGGALKWSPRKHTGAYLGQAKAELLLFWMNSVIEPAVTVIKRSKAPNLQGQNWRKLFHYFPAVRCPPPLWLSPEVSIPPGRSKLSMTSLGRFA